MSKLGYKWLNNVWLSKTAILCCNALLLPFVLPLIAWLVICQCYSAVLSGVSGSVGGATVLTLIGLLPCALVYAVGLAGAVYCYKEMLVDGNMDVRRQFARGIKKNALKYLLFIFILWLSSVAVTITPTLYSYMGISLLYGIGLAVSIFQLLVIAPAMCLCMMQCAFYDDKLRHCLINSFKLCFMRPLRTIGVTLVSALPFCLCPILPFVPQLVFWVLFSVVGVSIGMIFYIRYAKRYFDSVVGRIQSTDDVVVLGKDDPPAEIVIE